MSSSSGNNDENNQKEKDGSDAAAAAAANDDSNGDNNEQQQQQGMSATELAIIEMMKQQNLQQQEKDQQEMMALVNAHAADGSKVKKKHAFWDTQPMPHTADDADKKGKKPSSAEEAEKEEGPIQPNRPVEEIRQEPYTMPQGFYWSNVDVLGTKEKETDANGDKRSKTKSKQHSAELMELYNLLANNYVEDDDALFRFDYSPEFLLWALTPPGFKADWLFGVRSSSNNKLVAFISAIPAHIGVYQRDCPIVEINFLCVHKKLRSKRLAPVLIKEVTRRVNLCGIFQACYTAGTVLPGQVATTRYWHRSLNPKKLVKVGFSRLGHRMTMARMQKLYRLPDHPVAFAEGKVRPMVDTDVAQVHTLLNNHLKQYELKILFTEDEIRHWLLPREHVISTYVVDSEVVADDDDEEEDVDADGGDDKKKKGHKKKKKKKRRVITDLISFYHLPSSILHCDDTKLHAAYCYYNVATSVSLPELMKDALILAKQAGADVFNALDVMQNATFLKDAKFGIGDGHLQYYIYNWSCPQMVAKQVGIVLL